VRYILTFDMGTTAVKTCLYDEKLKLCNSSTEEYVLLVGEADNVVELDPEVYWQVVKNGILQVAPDPATRGAIAAISISTQGETMIPVDADGRALRRAIVWLDRRAAHEGAYISSLRAAKSAYDRTGVSAIDGMTPISKVLWIKHHESEVYTATHKILLLGDYIVHRLTGVFASEKTLMSTTAYYDIRSDRLFEEILDQAGISTDIFPEVYDSGTPIANVCRSAAEETGLSVRTVVVAGAIDQVAAAVGGGNLQEGIVTETTGTVMALMSTTDDRCFASAGGVNIYRHVLPGKFFVIPFCITAGVVLKWFKDEFCAEQVAYAERTDRSVYSILDELAAMSEPGANGLTVVPYFNGVLQPEVLPDMRGVFFGVSLGTKKPQFVRAIFEGVGYMLRENIEFLESIGLKVDEIRSFGGGSRSGVWQQIKADIVNKRICTMHHTESASLGVAALAAVASGMYPDIKTAVGVNEPHVVYEPDTNNRDLYDGLYRKYLTVFERTKGLFGTGILP